jgi:hypothetical protein
MYVFILKILIYPFLRSALTGVAKMLATMTTHARKYEIIDKKCQKGFF